MAISKDTRQKVYAKYSGRCAYCGREIAYKDMQVDHFVAKRGYIESGSDDIANLMPACRMCNHYKRANPLELFRSYIREIPRKLRENYIYKVGIVYGNVIENTKPIEFYFEKMEKAKRERKDDGGLKRCPFCGGEADCNNNALMQGGVYKWTVECLGCGLITPGHETEQEAIKFWNKRAESRELEFTRNFIHEHGLEYALLSAWNRRADHGTE